MSLKDDKQRNIQIELDSSSARTGEAREAGREETEPSGATNGTEYPTGIPSLIEECYSTCLCFALDPEEQKKSRFQYQYSVFQMEYSRNLLFRSGRQMEEIFQALIDPTRAPLDLGRIKTIFGNKHRPHRDWAIK
jgi:hypothetical protein